MKLIHLQDKRSWEIREYASFISITEILLLIIQNLPITYGSELFPAIRVLIFNPWRHGLINFTSHTQKRVLSEVYFVWRTNFLIPSICLPCLSQKYKTGKKKNTRFWSEVIAVVLLMFKKMKCFENRPEIRLPKRKLKE